jgi:hypothetical protein
LSENGSEHVKLYTCESERTIVEKNSEGGSYPEDCREIIRTRTIQKFLKQTRN